MRHIVNAVLIETGSVLLARRSPTRKTYANLWSFPGGHVEATETLDQALARELLEEIGIVATDYKLAAQIADPNNPENPATYHLYEVRQWDGNPAIQDQEHVELRWFELEEASALPDLALVEYRKLFARLRDQSSMAPASANIGKGN